MTNNICIILERIAYYALGALVTKQTVSYFGQTKRLKCGIGREIMQEMIEGRKRRAR